MGDIELEGVDESSANAELRVIALELMKIAAKKKMSFKEVAKEYIKNVHLLRRLLEAQKE